MNKQELKKIWETFTEKNDFILNPNTKHVEVLADGVLKLEKKYGLKLCPCRLGDGTFEKEVELLCPCNFKTHTTWTKEGRCWCGLFVKRE